MTVRIKHDNMEFGRWFLAYYNGLSTQEFADGYLPNRNKDAAELYSQASDAFRNTRHELMQIVAHYDALKAFEDSDAEPDNAALAEAVDWAINRLAVRCHELAQEWGVLSAALDAHPQAVQPDWLLTRPTIY